ncbi:PREDICTED: gonadotropin-releasing hormone receptor-like [Priapulus caudatus]|uniref:Gonadotropin-releasing hormone receptor-like n=1 Tax=Priapulus caudatus TaxID=37621 RepID=A0ABM1DTF4_PRICU|nr:PREDICTED: gonadotropin-releasing hormone receptor-like [Priapulus caudatus]
MIRGRSYSKSRISLLMMHLAIADLLVAMIVMPMEVAWKVAVTWIAGDFMCRCMMVLRSFGLYLSSFILVCISLDRYFAIVHPLSFSRSSCRAKTMLCVSWLLSLACSAPQVGPPCS